MKARRLELGLTQAQLAKAVGVQQPVIAQMESGRNVPLLTVVEKIAKGLDITPEALLFLVHEETLQEK